MKLFRGALALPAVLLLGTFVPAAHAAIELKLTDGTTTVDVTDGGVGDSCAFTNCVTYSGSVGSIFYLTITTGTVGTNPVIDLNSVTHASGAGTLTMLFSGNGFTPASNGFNFSIGGTNAAGASTMAEAFGGNSNTLFDQSHQLGATLNFNGTGGFSGGTSGGVTGVSPYSLTIETALSFTRAGGSSFDASIDPVPEPSSVALLGGLLLATATVIRRKLRRS